MKKRLLHEWQQLVTAVRSLDRQTVFVLTTATVFVILQYTLGNRRFFRAELASYFADEWRGLLAWGWWFGMQGVTGFVVPALALLLLFLWLGRRLIASRFGMAIAGIRENERRMAALGFPVYRYKLACFAIAGAVAGLAGALVANQTEFVSPSLMHWTRSGEILVMVILGGMGTLVGPVFGAAAFLLLEEILSGWTEHWMIVMGPLLIFVVLFARRGLYGWLAGRGGEA